MTAYHCRRPYCATPFDTEDARNKHEESPTPKHLKHGGVFICDWEGHAEAIETVGVCSCCMD